MKAVAAFLLVLCYLAVSHAWRCNEGPRLYRAQQIDAGQGAVVAKDANGYPYFLIGKYWYRLTTTRFRHLTVGPAGLWGATTSSKAYKYVAGHFRPSGSRSLQQVDAGGNGQVVGVGSYRAYCLRSTVASSFAGTGSVSWNSLSRIMRYYSCGKYGCWGIDTSYRLYFTKTLIPTSCGTSGWTYVSLSSPTMVEVGTDGNVFVVTRSGQIYQRTGISSRYPQGRSWSRVSMCMPIRHVSYDLRVLWAVTTSGLVMKCTH